MPVERYAVGVTLPPHVSPFDTVDDDEEHVPDYAKFLKELQVGQLSIGDMALLPANWSCTYDEAGER